jgi:hypothetical protein
MVIVTVSARKSGTTLIRILAFRKKFPNSGTFHNTFTCISYVKNTV